MINVKNKSDQFCFQWAILSCLYPAKNHPYRVSNYYQYRTTLNFDGIAFPVQVKDIPKFEKMNPEMSVNVISLDLENKGYCDVSWQMLRYLVLNVIVVIMLICFFSMTLTHNTTCG